MSRLAGCRSTVPFGSVRAVQLLQHERDNADVSRAPGCGPTLPGDGLCSRTQVSDVSSASLLRTAPARGDLRPERLAMQHGYGLYVSGCAVFSP